MQQPNITEARSKKI